ncbi:MAG TPA: hypothetical protein VM802_03645 [Chitinophaga sp.]|uniref:hypothetical protein n=1 Tax=Chitinophaga sp. TaxID=1869181 RepID=UPI002C93950C|nr:hypothetical protein [Chitinophaga sp.]HVI43928.1 hypothetical protein [Chitinophaga sp.]
MYKFTPFLTKSFLLISLLSGAAHMALGQAGANVGVDTNSPTAKLDVNGTTRVRTITAAGQTDSLLVADASGNINKAPLALSAFMELRQYSSNDFPDINTGYATTDWIAAITGIDWSLTSGNASGISGVRMVALSNTDGFWHVVGDLRGPVAPERWNRIQVMFIRKVVSKTVVNGTINYGQ